MTSLIKMKLDGGGPAVVRAVAGEENQVRPEKEMKVIRPWRAGILGGGSPLGNHIAIRGRTSRMVER